MHQKRLKLPHPRMLTMHLRAVHRIRRDAGRKRRKENDLQRDGDEDEDARFDKVITDLRDDFWFCFLT